MNIGPLEIGILIVVVLLLFGAKRLPEMGRGLGRGMREFKDGIVGNDDQDRPEVSAPDHTADPTPNPDRTPANH